MTWLRKFLVPDGLAGRFALLLACALIAANVVALILLSAERQRLDRASEAEREVARIIALVPALEAVDPASRRPIARDASTRFAEVTVEAEPLTDKTQTDARSIALASQLSAALGSREVRVAIFARPDDRERRDDASGAETRKLPRGDREVIAISVALRQAGAEAAPPAWLNVMTGDAAHGGDPIQEEVFLIILGLSLVAVLGVGVLFVRHLTRPLARLATAARAAGHGDRTVRVPEEGAREMREAAAAFNGMQAQIAQFDAERMRTLAAVGHDLRTPITSLRIRVEMLEEQDLRDPMIRTLDEMAVMADGLVAYARDSREAEPVQAIHLPALLARLCADRGVPFQADADVQVQARPVALGRAVGNLIDNALRYGKTATVALAAKRSEAIITVDDQGPGIPPERLESMFEPFVRGEGSRSSDTGGAGLGLSIARTLIVAHGGSLILENRKPRGLRATIRLPLKWSV